jgi:hypothetical protein
LAGLVWAARFRPGLAAAHRLFVAAMILARPLGIRRRFFLAAFTGAGVAAAAALAFRAAQRFLCAAVMRRRAAERAMRLGPSSSATALSKPRGPVMNTRTPPRNGSAAIRASYG